MFITFIVCWQFAFLSDTLLVKCTCVHLFVLCVFVDSAAFSISPYELMLSRHSQIHEGISSVIFGLLQSQTEDSLRQHITDLLSDKASYEASAKVPLQNNMYESRLINVLQNGIILSIFKV